MFPTLLASGAEGMQYLELKVDNETGTNFTSPTPLRVSIILLLTFIMIRLGAYFQVVKPPEDTM